MKKIIALILVCVCCFCGCNDTSVNAGYIKDTSTISTASEDVAETVDQSPTYTATEIYNQAVKYVGEITTYDKYGNENTLGTGFVYSANGKIITNYHVIESAYYAKIDINGKSYYIESVLAYNAHIDLAILKINATDLDVAVISNTMVQAGEPIYAIGSSRGLTNTYSQGIVTYANRIVDDVSYVQHDASITHGNSGGPLINSKGEIVGINAWNISNSQNLNFAISVSEIQNLAYTTPLSLEAFYEQNHNSYDLLISHVVNSGTYDAELNWYIIKNTYNYTDYTVTIALSYDIEGDSIIASIGLTDLITTSVFMNFSFEEGTNSSFYSASYQEKNSNSAFQKSNTTWGYFNINTFSDSSILTYSEYDGLESDKDAILVIYKSNILDWLSWLEKYLVAESLDITLADLGFTSYR